MHQTRRLKCCPYYRRNGHPLEQCVLFGSLFDENSKVDEKLLKEVGADNIIESPFPRRQDSGKGYTVMVCHSVTGAEMMTAKGESNLDTMAQRVQNLFKFMKSYGQMD